MNIASMRPSIFLGDKELKGYDAIIPRIGASRTFFGTAVVRQFEIMGVYSVNESVAISRSRDKLRSLQLLARRGIGLPVTTFAHDTKATGHMIQLVRRCTDCGEVVRRNPGSGCGAGGDSKGGGVGDRGFPRA